MFESKTYEALMEEALAGAPEDIDTRQGSIFYDAVSGIALKIAELYTDLDLVFTLTQVDTTGGEYLDTKASEYGLVRHGATPAQYYFTFTGTAPDTGERFFTDGEYFVLKKTELVSRLTAADVASITVETVTGYPGVSGFLPDVLPNTRTISMKDDGSFWIVGTPGDYNLKDMFLARLPDAESAVKVTLKLKDGNFNSMDAFVKNANLKRIIDINEKDFEMEDITTAFDGMDSIGTFDVKQSNTIKTGGTISYFFEPETGKPLAATYDTGIDTVNTFTMSIKIALSTLDAGASISANSHTKTIYIFDPKLVY